jgi:hypothetical protein
MEKAEIEVDGLETFRRVCLITSLSCAAVSGIVLACHPPYCDTVNLKDGIWTALAVQLTVFLLLLMHYIHCGCLLRKMGIILGFFYFCMVGAMFWA